jgi:predicted nucleotidyltransferase
MTDREQNIAKMIARRIKEKDSDAEDILYGSHARGDSHNYSDWDFLVLLNQNQVYKKIEQSYRHCIFDLELEIGEPISIFVYSKKIWESQYSVTPFYKSVQSEGIRQPASQQHNLPIR